MAESARLVLKIGERLNLNLKKRVEGGRLDRKLTLKNGRRWEFWWKVGPTNRWEMGSWPQKQVVRRLRPLPHTFLYYLQVEGWNICQAACCSLIVWHRWSFLDNEQFGATALPTVLGVFCLIISQPFCLLLSQGTDVSLEGWRRRGATK